MTDDILEKLRQVDQLKEVPPPQLKWLTSKGSLLTFNQGDFMFKKDDPIANLYIILKGQFVLKVHQNNEQRVIGTLDEKSITGALPYSRASNATGIAEAAEESEVLALHKDLFKEMIHEHHELTTALVHVMSSRIRQFTKLQQQNDKMMALGKLSAGLAHELNNPSAAVIRSAQILRKHLALLPEQFKKVIRINIKDEQLNAITELLFDRLKAGVQPASLMDKTSREDDISLWLEEQGIEDGYEIAENFVDFAFRQEELQLIADNVDQKDRPSLITWLNQVLATEKLVHEIEDASRRINALVKSVKSYTHMDQAPDKQSVDIHAGIDNTLTMLNHKLKKAQIEVVKNYQDDLPQPSVYVSEMNQVWTNLFDNAIDALEGADEKKLIIATKKDGGFITVSVVDSGPGIAEDIVDQVFDPFFTTKPVGKGTGLGLDIVQQIINQHKGTLKLNSKPGRTEFKICLPIE